MDGRSHITAADRNRALKRLRTLTAGTALASAAAVGAFGYVAAITNPGSQAEATTTSSAAMTQATGSTTTDPSATGTSTTDTSRTGSALQAAPGAASSTTGAGQVTTGGS